MTRYNLIQARGGDFTCGTEGIAMEGEGSDVISLAIKQGKVSIIVPPEVPDDQACQALWVNKHLLLEIELENGAHISGWIHGGEASLEVDCG